MGGWQGTLGHVKLLALMRPSSLSSALFGVRMLIGNTNVNSSGTFEPMRPICAYGLTAPSAYFPMKSFACHLTFMF